MNIKGTSEMTDVMHNKQKPKRKKTDSPFSRNLNAILLERSITQKQAATLMGVAVSVVHDWMNGTYPNDPSALLKLCKALSCDFQWLLTGVQSQLKTKANLTEVFDIHDDPTFSGIFMIEAKRLKIKATTEE